MHFSDKEKEAIKKAVQEVEKQTAGEVVPYYVKSSDQYKEASWLLVLLFSFLPTLVLITISEFELPIPNSYILIFAAITAVMAWFAPRFSSMVLRLVFSPETFHHRVMQRAETAFLEEQVFSTTDRIGVLIFISEVERKVIVLADKGINQVVKEDTWQALVGHVVTGVKTGKKADGLVAAIMACKDILLENGFVNRVKDDNELNDELRIG